MSSAPLEALKREIKAYEALLVAVHALPHARHAGDDAVAMERVEAALASWMAAS